MPRKSTNFGVTGIPGITQYSGIVTEEFLTVLQGQDGIKTYDEMQSNDPIVSAMLFAITSLLKRANWTVEPGEVFDPNAQQDSTSTEGEKESAEVRLVRTALFEDMDRTWPEVVGEALTMLPYGWAYHEIIYKQRGGPNPNPILNSRFADGLVGWRDFSIRSQKTLEKWEIEPKTGRIMGMWQGAPPDYNSVLIPIEKALLFRTTTRYNNPEGLSALRGAYRPWYFKKRIETYEAIGTERSLIGIPVIEVPAEITFPTATEDQAAQYEDFKKLATRLRMDEQMGIVFPMSYDDNNNREYNLRLLSKEGAGESQFDTSAIITRYDQRIAMTLLADFIMLGHERVGSFALSTNKARLFSIALESFLASIAEPINRYAIPKLLELNGIVTETPPVLVPGVVDSPNLEELGNYVKKLADSDIRFDTPEDEGFMRQMARMRPRRGERTTPTEATPKEASDGPTEGA